MSGIKISEITSSSKKEKEQKKERQKRAQINLSELSEAYRPKEEPSSPFKTKRKRVDTSFLFDNHVDSPEELNTFEKPVSDTINRERNGAKLKTQKKLATNCEQSGNKEGRNWQQTDNKPATNQKQNGNKTRPKKNQTAKSGNKVVAKPTTEVETKWQQTDNKAVTKQGFSSLVGLQRKVTLFLYAACKSARSKSTDALTLHHISQSLETTTGSVKTTLQRLEKKGCITRVDFKNGRGGWSKYELSEELYRDLLQQETDNKSATNWQQTDNKVVAKPATELATSLSSSNSSNVTNTNTTKKEDESWLQDIQIPDNLKSLGFGVSHIKQLRSKFSLSPEEIQHGLEAFSFDLEKGEQERLKSKGVQNLIGFFFGAMKNGGYNPVHEGFETAEDAAEKEMLERLRKKSEERAKRKKELEDLLFQEWIETKEKEELTELSPPPINFMDTFHKAALKEYFQENEIEAFKASYY